jgi:hypothetical protein
MLDNLLNFATLGHYPRVVNRETNDLQLWRRKIFSAFASDR